MQKRIFLMAFFLVCCSCIASQAGNRAPHKKGVPVEQKPPQIGAIKKMLVKGCGCSLQSNSDYEKRRQQFLFLSDSGDIVQMNIDGEDIRLKLVKGMKGKGKPRVGNHHSETYIAGQTTVTIDWTVSEVCDPQDESCEVTFYTAVITVNRGGQIEKVKARGMCGC